MCEKAVELSAARVTELQGALQNQAESLESSEAAREAVQVTVGTDSNDWTQGLLYVIPVHACGSVACF